MCVRAALGILVIRRRVVYFRLAYSKVRLPQFSPNGAGYIRRSGAFNILFNYCIHSRGE